jgi:two-component system chemotaxis response regulator CheY
MPNATDQKRVLIVDDSRFVREMIGNIVGQMGHLVLKAEDGADGLVVAQTEEPDLIILDVKMPRMGGVEVLKALRADARFQTTPIIMLTSEADVDVVSEALASQVNAYLLKDKPREIMKRLREYLG